MALADYVKKIPENPELDLAIELKYGKPRPTLEYVDRLPLTVVKEASLRIFPFPTTLDNQHEEVIRDNLRLLLHKEESVRILKSTLFLYHSLLGTL